MPYQVPLNTQGIDISQGINAISQGNQQNIQNAFALSQLKKEDDFKNALGGYIKSPDPQMKQNALADMYRINPQMAQKVELQDQQNQAMKQQRLQEFQKTGMELYAQTESPQDFEQAKQMLSRQYPDIPIPQEFAQWNPQHRDYFRKIVQGLPKPMSEYEKTHAGISQQEVGLRGEQIGLQREELAEKKKSWESERKAQAALAKYREAEQEAIKAGNKNLVEDRKGNHKTVPPDYQTQPGETYLIFNGKVVKEPSGGGMPMRPRGTGTQKAPVSAEEAQAELRRRGLIP